VIVRETAEVPAGFRLAREALMTAFIDSFSAYLTPQVTERIGSATGTDPKLVRKGLGIIGPLVVAVAARAARSPGGLQSLLNLVPAGFDPASGIESVVRSARDPRASAGMLSGVFGSGVSAIGNTLTRTLGVDATALLRIGTPLMLGAIAHRISEGGIEEGAIARQLHDEQRAFQARGDEVARAVQDAQAAGDEANSMRQKYTPHEWATARLAPIAAAQVVMMASPSGIVGVVGELASAANEIKRARVGAIPTSLVNVLFDGEISKEEVMALKDREVALTVVKEGVAAVKANTPGEAKSFGNLLVDIAVKTAEASKEGGFLGIGGTRVTKEEQAAIDAIKTAAG